MNKEETKQSTGILQKKNIKDYGPASDDSDEEVDMVEKVEIKKQNKMAQRNSVSAEAYGAWNKKENYKPKVIEKDATTQQHIRDIMNKTFLFNSLDDKEKDIVIMAMDEKQFKQGDQIIQQGDEGNHLYVVDEGELDCFKLYKDQEQQTYLQTYKVGEFFGELALLYNAPRAASIYAKTDVIIWALDRETFVCIVKDATSQKREKYETFLQSWALLSTITDPYEQTQISDALIQRDFVAGETIIASNMNPRAIFIVYEGQVDALDDTKQPVFNFQKQSYFGQASVVLNQKLKLDFVAKTEGQLLTIPETSYDSTLAIVSDILQTSANKFKDYFN